MLVCGQTASSKIPVLGWGTSYATIGKDRNKCSLNLFPDSVFLVRWLLRCYEMEARGGGAINMQDCETMRQCRCQTPGGLWLSPGVLLFWQSMDC